MIGRHFSTEGLHPYDQVAWERRDARITNSVDGSVVFEQLGVEVPSAWSLNATNILAQKYFRGTLGTPGRESSLRQVLDRVVDTITGWGVRDGYFTDPAESAAFSGELRWLILNQRVAFNSPVWFNIGVPGVPAQASACQPYHALVSTPEGLVPIGRLVEEGAVGAKVFDHLGLTSVVAVQANGHKQVLRVHTRAGITLDVSGDHLVWRASDRGHGRFVAAGDLRPGDRLEWHRTEAFGVGEISRNAVAEAALAGWRQCDGFVPGRLFQAPLPVVRAYLQSVFQAGGYVSLRQRCAVVGMDTGSEGIARGVQSLLGRFGIFSRVRFKADKRPDRPGCWTLTIPTLGDRQAFMDQIGFIGAAKAAELAGSLGVPGILARQAKLLEVARLENLGEMQVYDIQTESGEYLSSNLRVHNCFILAVADDMRSILDWYTEEGIIFKGGSGAGVNLSSIRSARESMTGGGKPSGPVSFMRGADASAGTIRSGGKTRRAAKMVILNADHPDIEDFVWCKALEERKARALAQAGFDMGVDGRDIHSVQYQNANNSVRVTDAFMRAVVDDAGWDLRAVTTGEVIETLRARDLWRQIAQASWECADPGLQFDTTINRWHTCPASGRINASNPCFTGDSRVHTDRGLVAFSELLERANQGESFSVYTHEGTNAANPTDSVSLSPPEALMITGYRQVIRLRFRNGMELGCTPDHHIFTANRGFVEARALDAGDEVRVLDLPTAAVAADWALPVSTAPDRYRSRDDHMDPLWLPAEWTEGFAHYLGWLIGDGSTTGASAATVYDSPEDRDEILPAHAQLLGQINHARALKPSEQLDGTVQLRLSCRPFRRFLEALGVNSVKGAEKAVPWAILQAPREVSGAFLRGLFDADGCVRVERENGSYVGLVSISRHLLIDVQLLLSTLGVASRICKVGEGRPVGGSAHPGSDGPGHTDPGGQSWDLRVSSGAICEFARHVGFELPHKRALLGEALWGLSGSSRVEEQCTFLAERSDEGIELTYNLNEPRNHSYIVNGVVVRNCSEYMHVDNSACNLASLNLLSFLGEDAAFDSDGFKAAVGVLFCAQEILVGNAAYPTEKIGENARRFRQLGIGYANLGAALMALGLAYDSRAGRAWAGAVTALMTGQAYATSALMAARMGPFGAFDDNRESMLGVLRMHRAEVACIDEEAVPTELLGAAREVWDQAVALAERHGVRNSQASVLAPTGTISFLMDCDTTGIEPDLSLVKTKRLVGGGTMSIVNQTVPRALRRLGYSPEEVSAIVAYVDEHTSIVGAPRLAPEHLRVFACSMGDNPIHHMGHVRMMAAAQPFVSGAISKTVNLPEDVTVEDIEQVHLDAWRLGLKAVAIYRDNCKVAQPLEPTTRAAPGGARTPGLASGRPIRERLPRRRRSSTFKFQVADCEGYVTVGEYADGRPGEVFMKVSKQGSTLAGIMDAFSVAISIGLQHGVPLATFVGKYINMRFEPAGLTDDPDIRLATSLVDYIFRRLAVDYLSYEERVDLGIQTSGERVQPSLPGLEAAGASSTGLVETPFSASDRVAAGRFGSAEVRDAPYCYRCGNVMQPAGACYVCATCGTTSGCS